MLDNMYIKIPLDLAVEEKRDNSFISLSKMLIIPDWGFAFLNCFSLRALRDKLPGSWTSL